MNVSLSSPLRTIRSFVIREGRFTVAQKRALTDLWPRYGIPASSTRINFDDYFSTVQPVVLDVGYGNGDSLLSLAQQRSDLNFIGVEVYRPGIGSVLQVIDELQINNVRLVSADVFDILQTNMYSDYLEGMMVWFPDPWPKKRHHKRRLVQEAFLTEAARVIKHNGVLHLASDWQPYVDAIIESVKMHMTFISANLNETPLKLKRPLTRFEKRGLRLGHEVTDLFYQVKKLT